jgi:hypothetical protein
VSASRALLIKDYADLPISGDNALWVLLVLAGVEYQSLISIPIV